MPEDDIFDRRPFERISAFEWTAEKAASNRRKHGIDFDEAISVFYCPYLVRRSDRNKEERWLAIGEAEGRVLAVAFTWRGDALRIVSARRARKNEKRAYHQAKMGRAAEGQD